MHSNIIFYCLFQSSFLTGSVIQTLPQQGMQIEKHLLSMSKVTQLLLTSTIRFFEYVRLKRY